MPNNFNKPYEYTPCEVRDDTKLNEQTALILEGYAMGLSSIMWRLTGDTVFANQISKMMGKLYPASWSALTDNEGE